MQITNNSPRVTRSDGELDYTTYDWQSNAAARTWTHVWPDGKVSFAYTISSDPSFTDRGTGISTYDAVNDEWVSCQGRVEPEKTGFGSIAQYGQNSIIVAAHTPTQCGVYLVADKDNITPGCATLLSYLDNTYEPTWPCVMTSGTNRDIIHVIATGYDDNIMYYFRSQDGGQTWDKQNVILPFMGTDYCLDWGSNLCYWMETTDDNCLALVVNNAWSDGMVIYSYDNGETWERRVFYQHPDPFSYHDDMIVFPRWTSCQWDSQHRLHVLYEFNGTTGDVGSGSYYPADGGVAYWNEYLPYNANGTTRSAIPGNLIPGQPFVMDNDYLNQDIRATSWLWSDATHQMWPEYIGYLPALTDNGEWEDPYQATQFNIDDRSLHGSYNSGICAFPVLCKVPDTDHLVAVWSAMDENHTDENGYYYYKLFASYSNDGGYNWTPMVHLTNNTFFQDKECVYLQAVVVNNKLVIACQMDGTTGTFVQSDDSNPYDNYYQGLTFDLELLFGGLGDYTYIVAMANPSQGGIVRGGGTYQQGQSCTLTATANDGYSFSNWTKDGVEVSTDTTFSFIVTETSEYVANFSSFPCEITATANPPEGGTITGGGTINYGQNCTLIATANNGYHFVNWTENGNIVSTNANYSFIVTGDRTLVANFMEGDVCDITFNLYDSYGDGWNGNKLVVTDENGNSQELTFSSGSSATYSLQLVDGSHITLGWISGYYIGECSFMVSYSNGNVIYHGFDLNSSFSYDFDVDCEGMPGISFAITAEANPEEGGTVAGDGIYGYGQTCTVTATANEGYTFMYWTEYDDYNGYNYVVSYDAEYSFYVDYSRDLVAHFALPFSITATASPAEGGTVTGDGIYDYGQTCTVTAMPNEGYCFYYWLEYGYVVSYDTNYSFVVTDNHELVGVFGPPLSITAEANPIEGGMVSGGGVFDYGTTCTLIAIPNENYTFMYWTENGWQVSSNPTYSFTVTNDRNLVAHFALPFSINVTANPTDGGTVIGTGEYDYGTTCTLTATPNPGYVFNNWTKNGSIVSCFSSLTINVTESAEYVANFQQTNGIVIGGAVSSSYNLPTYYYYSLTEQIYTASEMGGEATEISSVSFYNAGLYNMTRNMSVYMVNTNKNSFGSTTDWIPVTDANLVFSGNVTMSARSWVTIYFSTPFSYDGVSNVALIVDDNSYSYNSYTNCRTFNTDVSQAIQIYSYDMNYDPYAPNNYTGTLMSEKNQVIFGIPSYEFTLTISASPEEGGTVSGANGVLYYYGQPVNLVATPNEGYLFLNWSKNGEVVSCNATYSFAVTEDVDLEAVFMLLEGTLIGEGESTNYYLPSYSYYRYTLSQQIYTLDEIERSGSITSISYYNAGGTKTRNYDIYLVHTDKLSFDSINDWIMVSETDRVYSGSVTMINGYWTTIIFDTPFDYNGSSNLALIVDDNSGSWTSSPHMACRVFDTDDNQAVRIYSDNTNYDPYNPTQYNGALHMVKNQIILGFNGSVETEISDEICQGEDYLQNGFEIIQPEVGENEYSITLPSSQGLDSIVNLTLTVYPTYFFVEDTILCNTTSFQWHGNTYNESGIYYDTLQTVHGCDSVFQLSLELFNTPLGEFTYMNPTNNYPFTSLPITFSWDAVSGTEYYNLYLWNVNDPAPSTPFASNIYNRSCYVPSLQNHQTYNWYVEAVNTCFSTTSSVRSFSLNIPPTMNVSASSLNFGEVALNNSNTLNLYVSGNALDDTLTMQMTGEDASMFSVEQGANWNGLAGGLLSVTFSPTAVQYNYTANLVITAGTLTQTVQLTGSLADMFVFNTYVTQDVFEMNSTVPIYGTVMDANNNPAASAEVEVKVTVMNMTRSLFATTGADGHFSVDFVPAYSESGYYTINSGRVGHNSTAVHDDFNIPGMNLVTNDWILWDVVQNETSTGSIVIRNRSQIPLNNIQVTSNTLPEGCSFTFQPLSLAGMEEGVLEYSVNGTTPTNGYQEVALVATSSEGASLNFTVWYRCAEPRGNLYASPNDITTTMTKGINKIVDVMLYNNGTGPTGSVYLDLPSVDWLSVVGNDTLPSIAVQDSAYFSLRLSANENTPLVQYTGNIAINCERGDGLLLPYTIMAVSDSTGTLIVDVTDDYTYNGNGQHLQGATVTVKGYYSLETAAVGLTDSNGLFTVTDIPEGYYRMSITAPHHAEYQATIQIEGGQTNTQNIYLQYQAITYSWNVVPTEIPDEYSFELVVVFETNVPVPVVTIEMPETFPELEAGESFVFNYIVTNHGLINSYDATLYPPTGHPLYEFTPLITEIDTLRAQETIVIPCTMTRRTSQRSQKVEEALNVSGNRDYYYECPYMARTSIRSYYICRGERIPIYGYRLVNIGSYPCTMAIGIYEPWHEHEPNHHEPYHHDPVPPVTWQQHGCSDDPCQSEALEELNSCPPENNNTPKLPPFQPGNRRNN